MRGGSQNALVDHQPLLQRGAFQTVLTHIARIPQRASSVRIVARQFLLLRPLSWFPNFRRNFMSSGRNRGAARAAREKDVVRGAREKDPMILVKTRGRNLRNAAHSRATWPPR